MGGGGLRAMGKSTEPEVSRVAKGWISCHRDVSGKAGGGETVIGLSQALWRRSHGGLFSPLSSKPCLLLQCSPMACRPLPEYSCRVTREVRVPPCFPTSTKSLIHQPDDRLVLFCLSENGLELPNGRLHRCTICPRLQLCTTLPSSRYFRS